MALDRLNVDTAAEELHDITRLVQARVSASGVRDGVCFVYCPHTTAGLTIQENADPGVAHDILYALRRIVPARDPGYRHISENSDAHVKASMMGFSLMVPVADGRLVLGRWQAIYLCEFDGPRSRQVLIRMASE